MPTTNPFDMSRNVRSRAWTFSKVRSLQASRRHAGQGGAERLDVHAAGSRCRTGAWPISWKVSSASALMSIVSEETPRCSIRSRALVRVRWVVPKPGIVRPWTSRRSRPSMSQVVTATRSGERGIEAARDADVERRAGRELLDPLGQPRALDAEDLGAAAVQLGPSAGTNGVPGTSRFRPSIVSAQRERNPAERLASDRGCRRSWS